MKNQENTKRQTIEAFVQTLYPARDINPFSVMALSTIAKRIEYRKGEFWLTRGTWSTEIGILSHGTAMLYRYQDGLQQIIRLWNQYEALLEGSSLMPKPRAGDRIIFLEASEVLVIKVNELIGLEKSQRDLEGLIGILHIQQIEKLQVQLYNQKFSSPEQRLAYALDQHKKPFSRLTVLQKASYLGVSKQSLYNLLANNP